jgi:hypothetical protein
MISSLIGERPLDKAELPLVESRERSVDTATGIPRTADAVTSDATETHLLPCELRDTFASTPKLVWVILGSPDALDFLKLKKMERHRHCRSAR